jgi:hypothetical protein
MAVGKDGKGLLERGELQPNSRNNANRTNFCFLNKILSHTVTTKSEKNWGKFFQIVEFYDEIGRQPR